jgi:WASH complex subunit strumpellin
MIDGHVTGKEKSTELSQEVISCLYFLEEFAHYSRLPRRSLEQYIPAYLLDEYRHHAHKVIINK